MDFVCEVFLIHANTSALLQMHGPVIVVGIIGIASVLRLFVRPIREPALSGLIRLKLCVTNTLMAQKH